MVNYTYINIDVYDLYITLNPRQHCIRHRTICQGNQQNRNELESELSQPKARCHARHAHAFAASARTASRPASCLTATPELPTNPTRASLPLFTSPREGNLSASLSRGLTSRTRRWISGSAGKLAETSSTQCPAGCSRRRRIRGRCGDSLRRLACSESRCCWKSRDWEELGRSKKSICTKLARDAKKDGRLGMECISTSCSGSPRRCDLQRCN